MLIEERISNCGLKAAVALLGTAQSLLGIALVSSNAFVLITSARDMRIRGEISEDCVGIWGGLLLIISGIMAVLIALRHLFKPAVIRTFMAVSLIGANGTIIGISLRISDLQFIADLGSRGHDITVAAIEESQIGLIACLAISIVSACVSLASLAAVFLLNTDVQEAERCRVVLLENSVRRRYESKFAHSIENIHFQRLLIDGPSRQTSADSIANEPSHVR